MFRLAALAGQISSTREFRRQQAYVSQPVSIASSPAFINILPTRRIALHHLTDKAPLSATSKSGLYSANFWPLKSLQERSCRSFPLRAGLSSQIQPARICGCIYRAAVTKRIFQIPSGIRGASCPPHLANRSMAGCISGKMQNDIVRQFCRSTRRDRKHCRSTQVQREHQALLDGSV